MITMILDDPAYLPSLSLAALRGLAIHLHAGIIGAVWCESPARDKAAFAAVQAAINAFPVEVAA